MSALKGLYYATKLTCSTLYKFISYIVNVLCSGLDSLYKEGVEYLRTVFSQPGKGGALLVCGMSGSGGSGCGKSSLAKLLCKHLSAHPYYSNVAFVDCTAMRGVY